MIASLEEMFELYRKSNDSKTLRDIFIRHGGLCASFRTSCIKLGLDVHQTEIKGYMYEALPIAISEWDRSKGKASTAYFKVVRRLVMRQNKADHTVGSVRVPWGTKRKYEKLSTLFIPDMVDEPDQFEYMRLLK